MKQLLFVFLLLPVVNLFGQVSGEEYTVKDFAWTIKIPHGFEKLDAKEWEKTQNKGVDIIGDHLNQDLREAIEINETFFVVSFDKHNVLEVSKQPYDKADGEPEEQNRMLAEILAETFKESMPGTAVTTRYATEEIGGKTFYKTTIIAKFPNGIQYISYMYNRIFGNNEFCINIMYVNPIAGRKMLDAVKASTFK